MVRSMRSSWANGSILMVAFLLIQTSFIKEIHSLPTNRQNTLTTELRSPGLLQYFLKDRHTHKRQMIADDYTESFPAVLEDVERPMKRGSPQQPSCPQGISERECNYELMAVWIRMLMKDNQ